MTKGLRCSSVPHSVCPGLEKIIAQETILSVITCKMCNQLAKRMVICDACGWSVCEKHRGEPCWRCSRGKMVIEWKQAEDAIQKIEESVHEYYKLSSTVREDEVVSPLPENTARCMSVEIRQLAKYSLQNYGVGYLDILLALIPDNIALDVVAELKSAGCQARYDPLTSLLYVNNEADRDNPAIVPVSPVAMDVPIPLGFTPKAVQSGRIQVK